MKKGMRFLTVTLVLAVLCGAFAQTASARDLEPCYHCNSTGQFYCSFCNNQGEVLCDQCDAKGGWTCADCGGSGYFVCESCHGDTYIRSGEGEIPPDAQPGTCGNCGGSGKIRCITCHTEPGWNICSACGGKGKSECQASNCKDAKAVGWKCPYCKGAGYLGVGFDFPPEWNDGVHNIPVKGDHIITDNKTWAYYVYGGETGNEGSSSDQNQSAPDSGNNDENKSETPQQNTTEPPAETDTKPSTTEPDPPEETAPREEADFLPENRTNDYDLPIPQVDGNSVMVFARVETGKMSETESSYYTSLSDGELAEILAGVQEVVGTITPGRFDVGVEELLHQIAELNDFETIEDGRLFPIYFNGHQDIGFPVKVTFHLDKGILEGGTDLFVYHITQEGEIEPLGQAEYFTYDDGSVEEISFYTAGFSSFFTAAKELDTLLPAVGTGINPDTAENETENEPIQAPSSTRGIIIGIVCAVVVAAAAGGIVLILKKRKTNIE